MKVVVVNTSTQAFDHHVVALIGEQIDLEIRLKDQNEFDAAKKGDELDVILVTGDDLKSYKGLDVAKLICESVSTQAFDDQRVYLKGEKLDAVIRFKNRSDFDSIKKGDAVIIDNADVPNKKVSDDDGDIKIKKPQSKKSKRATSGKKKSSAKKVKKAAKKAGKKSAKKAAKKEVKKAGKPKYDPKASLTVDKEAFLGEQPTEATTPATTE